MDQPVFQSTGTSRLLLALLSPFFAACFGADGTAHTAPKHTAADKALPVIFLDQFVNKNVGDPDFPLSATSNNSETGVTFSSTDPNVISVKGNMAKVVGEGFADLIASQSATANFAANAAINRISVFPNLPGADVSYNGNYTPTTALITNGILSVEIPRADSYKNSSPATALAPLQNFTHSNGTWANAAGPIFFQNNQKYWPTSLSVNVLVKTKYKVVIEVAYTFTRPDYQYGDILLPGGPGYYKAVFTVRRGEKVWSMEQHTDCDIIWQVPMSNGLTIDRARWRGYSSGSHEAGYKDGGPNGPYPMASAGHWDHQVDIDQSATKEFRFLTYWDAAGQGEGTGRYWQFYNSGEGSSGNLFGWFAGQASRTIGARATGPIFYTHGGSSYLRNDIYRRKGDASQIVLIARVETAFFVSTKTDLYAHDATQPINVAWNNWSGLGRKVDYYRNSPIEVTQAFRDAAIFRSAADIQKFIARIKTDATFANKISEIDFIMPEAVQVMRGERTVAAQVAEILHAADSYEAILETGQGIANFGVIHWKLPMAGRRIMLYIMLLLADRDVKLTATQEADILKVAALLVRIVWDNDFAPYHGEPSYTGIGLGNANMRVMYENNGRRSWALMFAKDIEMQQRASVTLAHVKAQTLSEITENGESHASPHYQQPAITPLIGISLQLRQAGLTDLFTTEPYAARWNAYADFFKSFATPKSVRWKNNRKIISFGDGNEEASPVTGLLGEGLRANAALSSELLSLYQHGKEANSTEGTIALSIDFSTAQPPDIFTGSSANFPGYYAHARFNVGTTNETAVWTLTGNELYDHRHVGDHGHTSIYIKGVPVSVASSAFYTPLVGTPLMHSVVLPVSIAGDWAGPLESFNKGAWNSSTAVEYAKMHSTVVSNSKHTAQGGPTWNRKIVTINANSANPVVVFLDGIDNGADNIFTIPIVSANAGVETPAGKLTPIEAQDATLPTSTPEQAAAGNINAFTFTGANYHTDYIASGGLDHTVLSVGASTFTISQWATTQAFSSGDSQGMWSGTDAANWVERQQYLRIKKSGDHFNVLLSYDKGTHPFSAASESGGKVTFADAMGTYVISKDGYYYSAGSTKIIASFGPAAFSHAGHSISGGIAEVTIAEGATTARIHGASGSRTITTPGTGTDTIKYTTNGLSTFTYSQGFTPYKIN